MDDNSLFACLDDDLRFEEPVRKKKRSSILKQTNYLGSENCDVSQTVTEVESKKDQKAKRVSFANKFQVKEMNTGNIYDIPGEIETPKSVPSQNFTEVNEDKENREMPTRNKYMKYPDSFSVAPDLSFNQSEAVAREVRAKDSLRVWSPASDDMELTQLDKSIFPSPALSESSFRGGDLDTTCLTSVKEDKTDVFQESILPGKFDSSRISKNWKDNSGLPGILLENTQGAELDMTCAATTEKNASTMDDTCHENILSLKTRSPSKYRFTETSDLPCVPKNIQGTELEITCVGTMEKNAGIMDDTFLVNILSSNTNSPNKYKATEDCDLPGILKNSENTELDMTCVATILKEDRPIDNSPDKCKATEDYDLPGILKSAENTELDMTCVATILKEDRPIDNSPDKCKATEDYDLPGILKSAENTELDMTCVATIGYKRNILPGALLQNTQGNDLDVTCMSRGLTMGGTTQDIFNESILNMERSSKQVEPVEKAKLFRVCDPNSLGLSSRHKTTKDGILSMKADINNLCTGNSSVKNIHVQKHVEQSQAYCTNPMELTCAGNTCIDESFVENSFEPVKATNMAEAKKQTRLFGSSFMDITCPQNAHEGNETTLNGIYLNDTQCSEFVHEDSDGSRASLEKEGLPQIAVTINEVFHDEEEGQEELMQLTCATLNKGSLPESGISAAEEEDGDDYFMQRYPGKSLKRNCTTADVSDACSSQKKTKSRTPAIVYKMRRTKVTTEDVQEEIYLTPELEEAMNSGDVFKADQDECIFSLDNLKRQKLNSDVERIIATKMVDEIQSFSSSIVQCNEDDSANIAYDRELVPATHNGVSTEISNTNKISESWLFSSSMLQSGDKSVPKTSCKTNIDLDQKSAFKPVLATPEVIFSTTLAPDCRVENSLGESSNQLENDNSESAVASEILTRQEFEKPTVDRENSVKQGFKVSGPSKEESKLEDPLIEAAHKKDYQHIPKAIENSDLRETDCSFVSNNPSKIESSMPEKKQSKVICILSDKSSILSTDVNEPVQGREKLSSPIDEKNCLVPRIEFTATKDMTPKSSDCLRIQTTHKKSSFEKKTSSSGSVFEDDDTPRENAKNASTSLQVPFAKPQSKNSFRGESNLDREMDSASSASMIPKTRLENSVSQPSKALLNSYRRALSSSKFFANFNQSGAPRESVVSDGYSFQLLPDSLLNDSISLCGTSGKYDVRALYSMLPDCSLVEIPVASPDPETIADGKGSSDSGDVFLKTPSIDCSSLRDDGPETPSGSSGEINKEMEPNEVEESTDKCFAESKIFRFPSLAKESDGAVEEDSTADACVDRESETDLDSLPGAASLDSSIEPAENSLLNLTRKIEEASGSKTRWFLVTLREDRAVFQLNFRSYLFCCKLKVQMDHTSLAESRVSFTYKSRGEEIEDFGYRCFLNFATDKSFAFPVCSDHIIKKMEDYAELATKVEILMNDVMHLILFFDTTVSEDFNPLKIKTEVLNENLISKFSLTYEVEFSSYPQKIVPKVEHLRLENYEEKIREAVATVEPGPRYLWKMADLAQSIS